MMAKFGVPRVGHSRSQRHAGACLLAVVMMLGLLVGCGSPGPQRSVVPDDVLFAEIARLPGVIEADVFYDTEFSRGKVYAGRVTVEDEADPLCVLDRMVAILWQGRSIAVSVVVAQGDESYRAMDLDPETPIQVWKPERYGPRPDSTTFVEPELPPACR